MSASAGSALPARPVLLGTNLPHEVWCTQGQGGTCIAAFASKKDARAFLDTCVARGDASYGIRTREKLW